jgi:hypothetical protein
MVSPGGPFCGDHVVNGPEVCDLGDANGATACGYGIAACTGCNASCSAVTALGGDVCGNGNLDATYESCDDHNTSACGTCSADCRTPIAAAQATGLIVTPDGASLNDGDTFQLDDGIDAAVTFEFTNGTASGSNVKITHASTNNANAQATQIVNAIIGQSASLHIAATSLSGGIISLANTKATSKGNQPIVVSTSLSTNPGWASTGMSGGAAGDCAIGVGCSSDADCGSGTCDVVTSTCQ